MSANAKEPIIEVDPRNVRFTHSKIRPQFSGCGKLLEETLAEIVSGKLRPEDLPMITVHLLEDGQTYCSLNNRRLWIFKQCREMPDLKFVSIKVRLKPLLSSKRNQDKYSLVRCSNSATFLRH